MPGQPLYAIQCFQEQFIGCHAALRFTYPARFSQKRADGLITCNTFTIASA